MMKKIVDNISKSMVKDGIILESEQDIYDFGIECLLLKLIHYISYITIAIIMQQVFDLFVIACAFFPIRGNAGGYHAKTRIGCYIVSCLTVFSSLLFYKQNMNNKVYIICWLVASIIIYLNAPIDNEGKIMSRLEIHYYQKKTRIAILVLGALIGGVWVFNKDYISKMLICGIVTSAIAIIIEKQSRK
jgi:accessory gene regulator B